MNKVNRYIPQKTYEYIQIQNHPNAEQLYVILDIIVRISAKHSGTYKNDYVDIPRCYFKEIITDSETLTKLLEYLKSNKLIDCDNLYSKIHGKSLGYRINQNYISKIHKVKIESHCINKRIITNVNKQKMVVNDRLKKYKKYFLDNFKIKYDEAMLFVNKEYDDNIKSLGFVESINKYNHYVITIESINDGELYFNRNKTNNRIDTNLTSLPKRLRKFINIDNLRCLDIVNSQPFFLNLHYHNTTNTPISYTPPNEGEIIPKDVGIYSKTTISGKFYEYFIHRYYQLTKKEIKREDVKPLIYEILYSQVRYKNKSGKYKVPFQKDKEIFKMIFPTIYDFTIKEKTPKHNQLAIKMQLMESDMCIDIICKELEKNNINYFTIHDSWIVDDNDMPLTEAIIKAEFNKKYKSQPTLHRSKITK